MEEQPQVSRENMKVNVESMFDSIAWRYDFLNHFLSFGVDRLWRRRAVRIISRSYKNPRILDVATGTGDLAIAAMRLDPVAVEGIDISGEMLKIGTRKINTRGFDDTIKLTRGDSENIPFNDNSFDVAMVAFGVRNFSDPLLGLSEMRRVLRDRGMILVLEFSKPTRFPLSTIYNFYFSKILPSLGKLFSRNRTAYTYLPESVMKFPDNEEFMDLLSRAGYSDTRQAKLTGGIASIYTGIKQAKQ